MLRAASAMLALSLTACASAPPAPSSPPSAEWAASCGDSGDWDTPGPPFRIHANTWYVGTCGIAAILITGNRGHVLIDGGTAKGGELIAANIERLGFRLTDVKLLLHSHEHFDHAAGLAYLQQRSGATLVASPAAAPVLDSGKAGPDDPQHGLHPPFPAARVGRIVLDGETISLGPIRLKAVATPGHTPGAMTWQWRSCLPHGRDCRWLVYADSLSPISADSYRFSDHPAYLAAFRAALDRLGALDCDILLTPHPGASDMRGRLLSSTGLVDSAACRSYAADVRARLDARIATEAAAR